MESTIGLVDLLGAAALLLWGLRMIKTGVLRAYGTVLRQRLGRSTANRFMAAFWGFLVTLGLQSSTATAVIIASFTARDIIRPRMAQAMMLGANFGTAVVALVLSADIHWVGSALLFCGVMLFNLSQGSRNRNLGRAIIGLGLMLLALQLLGGVTAPLRESETLITVLAALGEAPVFAVILSAGLAVMASSSLAVVVLVMMLAAAGVVGPELALWLVAGANLGGAIPPYLAVRSEGLPARRLTLANLLVRSSGAMVVLIFAAPLAELLSRWFTDPAAFVAAAHLGFSAVLLLVFLPLLGPVTKLAELLLPARADADGEAQTYLDEGLMSSPDMAIAVAARETLRMGDLIGSMLDQTQRSLRDGDEAAYALVSRQEEEVDRLHEAIKLYVARISRLDLEEDDARRASEVISYAINLEHVGDIIKRGLAEIAAKKARKKLSLSPEGLAEISEFFQYTRDNLQLAQAIFMSRDPDIAKRLLAQKIEIRKLEARSAGLHMARMRAGRTESVETSSIHLDLLRDLKRVNAHLASVAYPILEEIGLLDESRLRSAKGD
ncbi:MAG: sodium:phosphate symporter [Devosia sp. 63-57]|nr:Na/Pi cotransporter family protein [uncultured Devosia sp.]ODT49230.1 MAG: sodium:phosphate symporter [Pelagibacterium sp. SCN 63-126]ODU85625.1 MAG: sodium:phosphate symporter [Pelagibacterium sp. SCN 63-17]OJX43467.1 MAG: sodium:phosphate symporter [Devosia sp. 63-57]